MTNNNKGNNSEGNKITYKQALDSLGEPDKTKAETTFEQCGKSQDHNSPILLDVRKGLCNKVWKYHAQKEEEEKKKRKEIPLSQHMRKYNATFGTEKPHPQNNVNAYVTPKASLAAKMKPYLNNNKTNVESVNENENENNNPYEGNEFEEYEEPESNNEPNNNVPKTGGSKTKKGGMMLVKQALIPAILTASAISYKKKKRKNQKGGLLALGANDAAVATLVAARMSLKNRKNKKGGKKTKGRKPKRKGTRKK